MADVSVEFGAQDTGLENTLKTIQEQLVALDGELKSGTLSFDEINKKMREAAQAEKLHASLGGTKDQIEALGLSFNQAKPQVEKFAENQKEVTQETQKASTSFQTMAGEMFELKAALENGNLSADEFDKTLRRLNKLEDIQQKMDAFKQSTTGAGESADQASPEVEELGTDIQKTGKEAEDFGEKSKGGFLKMSGAVAAGQLAAEAAMAGIRAAINLAKGAVDEFAAALDLGGRLSDLAARTGEAEGNLLLLERAFQNSGAGAEAVGPAINKLQNFMQGAAEGGAAQTAAMERLGISMQDLSGKTPIQQLEIFAQRISGIEDPTQRTALAMDVFGRSGGELLPLLTNFSGELGTAQSQLGGMVDIMNRNAATFDAASDKIKIVKGKFMEFAAGILDRAIPALDAITEGLSRIDAAAIGQKLANAFLGGTQAMQGFQAAVDAFKIGEFGRAFELIFESIKLQLMQTGNAIITNFTAAFKTVGDIMAEIFRADGPSFMVVRSAFDFVASYAKEKIAGAMSEMFASMGPAFSGISDSLKQHSEAGATAAELALQRIPVAAGLAAEDIGNVLSNSTQTFKDNLAESESKFFDIGEQSAKVAELQNEITAAVARTNTEKQKGIDISPVEQGNVAALLEQEKQRLQNELASSAAKADAAEKTFAQIENEIELNNAIASGNEQEIERVKQKQKQAEIAAQIKANEESIPAIIEDIIAKTGTSVETARQMAEELIASKNAALGASSNAGKITENLGGANKEAQTVKGLMDEIANAKMEASPERLKERTIDARKELKGMRDFIGQDLSQMQLDDIIDKLGLDPEGKLKTTDQKLRAVEGAIKDIGGADPAEITPQVDEVGVNDKLEKVKGYLANIGKKKTDATPQIDQKSVEKQATAARNTIKKDLEKLKAEITVKPKLDKEALKEEVDMAFASSKGTEHLSNIDKLVETIKGFVEKIEGKLPLQALAY